MPSLSSVEELLPDEEEPDEPDDVPLDDIPAAVHRASNTSSVTTPSSAKAYFFWNFLTAASVFSPKWPVISAL